MDPIVLAIVCLSPHVVVVRMDQGLAIYGYVEQFSQELLDRSNDR